MFEEELKDILVKIKEDQLLPIMIQDSTSNRFYNERVYEMLSIAMTNEQEK